jgi:NAD(P)-dependent dehydrogenase (short-subunit alcohol dehydrogenase family)
MNGYEFIKKINEIQPEIKVFLITAFEINDTEFKRLLPKVKIEGFMQKPISLANLTSTVSNYIHHLPSRKWLRAIEGLSRSMRYELEPFGIKVVLVEPGVIGTNFFNAVVVAKKISRSKFSIFADNGKNGSKV